MKAIAAIIVTHNRLALLKECIDSIRQQTFPDFQIIVVNNASTDGTHEWLSNQSDIITISQDNLGGAGGFFTGIKYAAENQYEYCWLMDDDVECKKNALEELYKAHHTTSNIGFVCSHVHGIDGNEMNTPTPDMSADNNSYPETFKYIDNQMVKVESATFVSILFQPKLTFEIGLPYKEYFIWGDDTEYTRRISEKHPSYIVGSSLVIHKRAQQSALNFELETNTNRINNFFFYFRNNHYLEFKKMSLFQKFFFTKNWMKRILSFIRRGNTKKAQILWSAYKSFYTFNPQICHPQANKNSEQSGRHSQKTINSLEST